ncbi:tryptophan dimethylallyltransferase family protein [Micromonospora thermarum]|uniref:Tryptophan dimethylallyltransferase n=1 Tax=Micromonospora thermarum TaxID=2720024 RepID=A0ABX0ZCI7_9ACTN|nr:tryptophan dimethylallyltransferase family protein [Micromonospora thermarum]NJP35567.1 hypothetical protein [Micromonospora thermarum]
MRALSLGEHLSGQLGRLCEVTETDPKLPLGLLNDVLGPTGSRPLSTPPAWHSDVADDHTPVEFSIAFNRQEPPSLRILAEPFASPPGTLANQYAAYTFLATQADRFGLSTARLDSVRHLFVSRRPHGAFTLWCSLVFRSGRSPEFKVYFNPEVDGVERAPDLVAEALRRLGMGAAYRSMLGAVRPGELGRADRLTFFAVDLQDGPQARVKLYLSHHRATVADVVRSAAVVGGVDAADVAEFCQTATGGIGPFSGRPIVGSYTLLEGSDEPVGYSVYVPIRSYVTDDQEARARVLTLLDRFGFRSADLDRAIAAVTRRPLRDGVGLIAHVSLRLGPPRPGVTVYLSSEAYRVDPPRAPYAATRARLSDHPASRVAAGNR